MSEVSIAGEHHGGAQSIGPGTGYSYEIAFGGSGNRNEGGSVGGNNTSADIDGMTQQEIEELLNNSIDLNDFKLEGIYNVFISLVVNCKGEDFYYHSPRSYQKEFEEKVQERTVQLEDALENLKSDMAKRKALEHELREAQKFEAHNMADLCNDLFDGRFTISRVQPNAEMVIEGVIDFSQEIEHTLGEFAGQYGPETNPLLYSFSWKGLFSKVFSFQGLIPNLILCI